MSASQTQKIAKDLTKCFLHGNKILICGNGGSAAESQHMAAEFMGRFELERPPLPAIALTTDTSFLTAWSNDYNYESVFSRQIVALGKPGDILITLSTSGKSANCLHAASTARSIGMKVIEIPRIGKTTPKIQENQLKIIHNVCRIVEREMFS